MKKLLLAAVAVAALASPASARDYWNGSGFPLDHNFHSPFDNLYGRGYDPGDYQSHHYPGARILHVPQPVDYDRGNVEVIELSSERVLREQNRRAVEKAIADERTCAPVILYTDDGIVRHHALGCH
jgi:hypothetical protein